MTIAEMVRNQQQQRIGELAQKQQGKAHVNPRGTPGMSLNDAGDFRKMVPVDDGVVQRLSASWTLNEIFHSEATRPGEYVHQQDPSWDWGKPFDTSILDGYRQGVDRQA